MPRYSLRFRRRVNSVVVAQHAMLSHGVQVLWPLSCDCVFCESSRRRCRDFRFPSPVRCLGLLAARRLGTIGGFGLLRLLRFGSGSAHRGRGKSPSQRAHCVTTRRCTCWPAAAAFGCVPGCWLRATGELSVVSLRAAWSRAKVKSNEQFARNPRVSRVSAENTRG